MILFLAACVATGGLQNTYNRSNLSQYPIGVTFIIEVTRHVEPVGAPIVHVVAGCFDALERTYAPTV